MKNGRFVVPGVGVPAFLVKYAVKSSEWQQVVQEGSWGVLMRPGFDLRVRIFACSQLSAPGYPNAGGEFCIMQVGRQTENDPPKFVPLTASAIASKLLNADIKAFGQIDKELTEDERKKRKKHSYALPHIRRVVEGLEIDDGVFTRVTMTKFLAADEATQELGWADLRRLCGLFEKRTVGEEGKWVQVSEGLSFEEARAQKLITRICELGKKDRQRLNGKSYLYCHVHPRPATLAALSRRTMDDVTGTTANGKELHLELGKPAQYVFKFLRARGIEDPKIAAQISTRPEVQSAWEQISYGKSITAAGKGSLDNGLELLAMALKAGRELPPAIGVDPLGAVQDSLIQPQIVSPQRHTNGHAAPTQLPVSQPAAQQPRTQPSAVLNPNSVQDAPAASTSTSPASTARAADPDLAPIATAMQKVEATETRAIKQLFHLCRAQAPDCTPAEVAIWVDRKIAVGQGKKVWNWTGYLLKYVPPCFESPGFEAWRAEQRVFAEMPQRREYVPPERGPDLPPDTRPLYTSDGREIPLHGKGKRGVA